MTLFRLPEAYLYRTRLSSKIPAEANALNGWNLTRLNFWWLRRTISLLKVNKASRLRVQSSLPIDKKLAAFGETLPRPSWRG